MSQKAEDVKQYLKVCEFREELEKLGIVGSYEGVRGSENGFFEHVDNHLRQLLIKHFPVVPKREPEPETYNAKPNDTEPPRFPRPIWIGCRANAATSIFWAWRSNKVMPDV
ncbi:MAG: hypothetical protein ABFS02_02420 [Pseudomonadota bacterium]